MLILLLLLLFYEIKYLTIHIWQTGEVRKKHAFLKRKERQERVGKHGGWVGRWQEFWYQQSPSGLCRVRTGLWGPGKAGTVATLCQSPILG